MCLAEKTAVTLLEAVRRLNGCGRGMEAPFLQHEAVFPLEVDDGEVNLGQVIHVCHEHITVLTQIVFHRVISVLFPIKMYIMFWSFCLFCK